MMKLQEMLEVQELSLRQSHRKYVQNTLSE